MFVFFCFYYSFGKLSVLQSVVSIQDYNGVKWWNSQMSRFYSLLFESTSGLRGTQLLCLYSEVSLLLASISKILSHGLSSLECPALGLLTSYTGCSSLVTIFTLLMGFIPPFVGFPVTIVVDEECVPTILLEQSGSLDPLEKQMSVTYPMCLPRVETS